MFIFLFWSQVRPCCLPPPCPSAPSLQQASFIHHLPLLKWVTRRERARERHWAFTPSVCTQPLSICHLSRQTRWQVERRLQLSQLKGYSYLERDTRSGTIPWCCGVLGCDVLCCVVLCCGVLCCGVLGCTQLEATSGSTWRIKVLGRREIKKKDSKRF